MSECQGFFGCVQVKTLLKDRLHGKDTGGSSEKSESTASVELTSHNFDELVVKSKELWVVEFFAPWYVTLNDTDFRWFILWSWLLRVSSGCYSTKTSYLSGFVL